MNPERLWKKYLVIKKIEKIMKWYFIDKFNLIIVFLIEFFKNKPFKNNLIS